MTGRHLFGTDSGLGILMRILRLDFPDGPDPWGHVDRMLPGAGSVLKKCVTAEPEDRFASAAALAEALEFIGDPASARQTLAVISARHLPDWMGVPFDQLEDPRTAQAIPIEDVDSSRTMPVPAVEPIGPEGVQGELGGRGATAMKVIPVTRPGGPTPKAPTRPRPDPTRPRPAAGEPERAPQPRKATAHPAPTPRGPSPRQVERARRNRNLWIGIGVAGGVLVLLLAAVLGLLLRG
jgi:hypothetical protein